MSENEISVGLIVKISSAKWRELERYISQNSLIVYVKKAPSSSKLKIVETKGEEVRENEWGSNFK